MWIFGAKKLTDSLQNRKLAAHINGNLGHPILKFTALSLAQILAQFQLSHHSVLFYFETGSLVGFVVLEWEGVWYLQPH